jgi:hypothetical protein
VICCVSWYDPMDSAVVRFETRFARPEYEGLEATAAAVAMSASAFVTGSSTSSTTVGPNIGYRSGRSALLPSVALSLARLLLLASNYRITSVFSRRVGCSFLIDDASTVGCLRDMAIPVGRRGGCRARSYLIIFGGASDRDRCSWESFHTFTDG